MGGIVMSIHLAAAPDNKQQKCAICTTVLVDYSAVAKSQDDLPFFDEGQTVNRTPRGLSLVDDEPDCCPMGNDDDA